MKRGVQFSIKYRPLSILAAAGAIRDILFGIGFVAGWGQVIQTLIYQNYNSLIPGISGPLVGIVLILCGLLVMWGAYNSNRKRMVTALNVQALIWMFSTIVYILNGYWLLAAVFGVFFSFPAGFTAMHIKLFMPLDEELEKLLCDKERDRVE